MLSRSLREQVKCRWREFRREPSAFFWVVFMPIVWMLALGFAFDKPRPEIYGVGWQASEAAPSPFAGQVRKALEDSPQIKLRDGGQKELTTLFQRGEIAMVVSVAGGDVEFRYDTTNPEAVRARSFVDDLVQRTAGRQDVIAIREETVQPVGGRYVDFLIPGLLGLSIMSSSLFGIAMTIVANRRENLLKRYLATPMKPYEYVVSHVIGRMIVLTAEFSAVMIAGFLIFRFHVFGNFLSYVVLSILGAAAFTAIALVCASRTRSIPMISGITNLISLPMMMLSGVFFSKNNFPDWLQSAVVYLPLTALNDGLRKIALEGQGLGAVGFEMAVLGVYFIVATIAARLLFRWY